MTDPLDPRGLIRESYRIPGITAAQCRSIFADWTFGDTADRAALAVLLARYGTDDPDHPMTAVLRAGLAEPAPPRRKGGRSARVEGG